MKASIKLINILILKLTGQYSGSGTLIPYIKFWFSRAWNCMIKNIGFWRPSNEFYPLLTDLIYDIYNIFGVENKTLRDCNEYIRIKLFNYFNIDDNNNEHHIYYNKFKNDIRNLRKLFKYSNDNFNEKDNSNQYLNGNVFDIQDNKFSEVGNFFLEQEKKFYTINLKNTLKTVGKNIDENFDIETTMEKSNLIENEIGNKTIEKNEIEEKELIEFDKMSINYSDEFGQILERITNYIKKNLEDMKKEILLTIIMIKFY